MKKLGVIGGLGPMATAYFAQLVTQMTDAKTDQEHIEMIIHSKPSIPDRTRYILGLSEDNPLPELLKLEQELVESGAEVIAIPCITAHFFQPELEKNGTEIIHAIRQTALYLKEEHIGTVGVMATDGTIQSRLFQDILGGYGINCIVPSMPGQSIVMKLIYDDVKAGRNPDMQQFNSVREELKSQGAEIILLGCTELSLIKRDCDVGTEVLDVMEVLARQAVIKCGQLKPEYIHLIRG